MSETDESDVEESFNVEEGAEWNGENEINGYVGENFAIGTVVFPVDKKVDVVDHLAILINHADSYVGAAIGKLLSVKKPGDALNEFAGEGDDDEIAGDDPETGKKSKTWKLLGTLKNEKGPDPDFLWATVLYDDFDAYITELLKCKVIIYDVTDGPTPERIREIRIVCDALRANVPTFETPRVFILISSLHSWSHTIRPQDNPDFEFTESNYRRRRTTPAYRDLQLLERYVVASGKMTRGMLKAYVVGAGAIYGEEESPLHTFFKSAWHNASFLPVYGPGNNILPTVYIKDLAVVIQNIIDRTPREQRYIIAVDPKLHTQEEILRAISRSLGSSKVKSVPEANIYANRELSTFHADQILLNLPITSTFCEERFNIPWTAQDGMIDMMETVVREYRIARNLIPFKMVIVGPPGIGKSTVARQISDTYHIHHFDTETMISSTIAYLREKAKHEVETRSSSETSSSEKLPDADPDIAEAKALLQLLDTRVTTPTEPHGEIPPDLFLRLCRYRLKTNPVKNQGFILDGLPKNFSYAMSLFRSEKGGSMEEEGEEDDEEFQGEGDFNPLLNPLLIPDHVFILEAPEAFITERLSQVPTDLLASRHFEPDFNGLITKYWKDEENYPDTFIAFLHEQEILYDPVDVSKDCSHMMHDTVIKLSQSLGKPRNYGLSFEEEQAILYGQECDRSEAARKKREEYACIKERLLDSRRKNIEQWMEKLVKIKREEFEREEAALIPLRQYLMAHVVPTLTKGLIDITRLRPEDPVDYLAEFLFQNNPGGINPSSGGGDTC